MQKFEDISKNNGSQSLYDAAESIGIPQSKFNLLPGRFYSLNAISPFPELSERAVASLNQGRPYYDLNPIGLVLFHEKWKETVLILNLKTMPPNASAKVLEVFYRAASQNGLDQLFKQGKLIPLEERQAIDQRFYFITPSVLSMLVGVNNLNYSINKYRMDEITAGIKLIDWDKFGSLINPKISTRGMFPENINLAQVYEEFITNSIK